MRRPPAGFGHYLRDLVYGALDGAITTMAVVAGTAGAALSARVGIILGLANLIADGLSMGASNYLGLKSELEQSGRSINAGGPAAPRTGDDRRFRGRGRRCRCSATSSDRWLAMQVLHVSAVLTAMALFAAGAVRAPFVKRSLWQSAVEMLAVGAVAGAAAYGVGALASSFLGG